MAHVVDQGAAAPGFEPRAIDVDVRGLDDFGTLLQAELDANLRPGRSRVHADHQYGATFGVRNASGEMQAARRRYAECLDRSMENLTSYIRFSESLIAAVDTIAARYRRSDAMSAATQQQIEEALSAAVLDAHEERAAARQQAQLRAMRRLGPGGLM